MRVIKEILNPACKITIFHWNNRYIIKLERDHMEQTFKIDQFDVTGEDEVLQLLDESFIEEALSRFSDMSKSLYDTLKRT